LEPISAGGETDVVEGRCDELLNNNGAGQGWSSISPGRLANQQQIWFLSHWLDLLPNSQRNGSSADLPADIAPPALKPDALRPESVPAATPEPSAPKADVKTDAGDDGSNGWDNPRYSKLLTPQTEAQKREEREQAAKPVVTWRGPVPKPDPIWTVSLDIHDAIKKQLADPDAYKFLAAHGPFESQYNGQDCWLIRVEFTAKNSFNPRVEGIADVYLQTQYRTDGEQGREKILAVEIK